MHDLFLKLGFSILWPVSDVGSLELKLAFNDLGSLKNGAPHISSKIAERHVRQQTGILTKHVVFLGPILKNFCTLQAFETGCSTC